MRMRVFILLIAAGMIGPAVSAGAQRRIGPVYPQNPNSPPPRGSGPPPAYSGYDPFQFDARTGRFFYAPIPYEPANSGSAYSPWQFNWYSGRWDYLSVPPETLGYGYTPKPSTGSAPGGGPASNYLGSNAPSVNIPLPSLQAQTIPGAVPVPKAIAIPPAISPSSAIASPRSLTRTAPLIAPSTRPAVKPHPPTTAPTTAPGLASSRPPPEIGHEEGWITLNGVTGRWQYDYSRGRWVFVLPPEP